LTLKTWKQYRIEYIVEDEGRDEAMQEEGETTEEEDEPMDEDL
jgi:hypothetical protein